MARKAPQSLMGTYASETCDNPWRPDCRSGNVVLRIYVGGRMRPICRNCWERIVAEGRSWG